MKTKKIKRERRERKKEGLAFTTRFTLKLQVGLFFIHRT